MGCGSSQNAQAPGRTGGSAGDDEDFGGVRRKYDKKSGKAVVCDGGKDDDGREDDFFEVEEAEGEQFMAVRPWIGQIEEPDNHNERNDDVPDVTYALEYVYGYRAADSRQNVYWNSAGQAVYMTAALGVILDPASNTQKFFGGGEVENTAKNVANDQAHHTDDIMCIAINRARDTAVSGQVGSRPTIFAWDAVTGEKKQRIKIAKGARGIKAIAINAEGMIAAADLHNDHHLYVFDASGNQVLKQKGGPDAIYDIAWDERAGSTRLMTGGKKHLYFWDASAADGDKRKGLFGSNDATNFQCVAWDESGNAYSGGSNGKVYIWNPEDRTCTGTIDVCKGFLSSVRFANGKLWAGGKDGRVSCIDTSSNSASVVQEFNAVVRAIDVDDSGNMVVGCKDGSIYGINGSDKMQIMASHCEGEVWGLAQ